MIMNISLKAEGNKCFQSGDYVNALLHYQNGLKETNLSTEEKCTLHKNMAQCYLKLQQFNKAEKSASEALSLIPNDVKAMFRLAVAQEKQGQLANAYKTARTLLPLDPKNTAVQNLMAELEKRVRQLRTEEDSLQTKLNRMMSLLPDGTSASKPSKTEMDTLIKAVNNISALLVEERAHEHIWAHPSCHSKLLPLLKCQPPAFGSLELLETVQRCIGLLIRERAAWGLQVLEVLGGSEHLVAFLLDPEPCVGRLWSRFIQAMLYSLSQLKAYLLEKEKYEADTRKTHTKIGPPKKYPLFTLSEPVVKPVNELMHGMLKLIDSRKLPAVTRDSLMEVFIKFVGKHNGINWIKSFLDAGGPAKVLEAASSVRVHSFLATTSETKMTGAVLLAKVLDDIVSDNERDTYCKQCQNFVTDLLADEILESKVDAAAAIGVLFMGPFDVGTLVLSQSGILEGMLLIINSNNAAYQKIALETLIVAANKKDKCMAIVEHAVPLLKELYKTGKDYVKIRALVGLCKMGSVGGTDASVRSLAEGSTLALAKSCLRYLVKLVRRDGGLPMGEKEKLDATTTTEDTQDEAETDLEDLARWAVEGLAYLTLDGDVKEAIANDERVRQALLLLAERHATTCLFPLCTVLSNITNSYEKPEVLPEMVELAKFSQQHVPEPHPKDADACVAARVKNLIEGPPSAFLPQCLFQLGQAADKLDSDACRELLARCYLTAVVEVPHRGAVVQSGGGKALIALALRNTRAGRIIAAQALARIAITCDPRIAFPGERALETIRPLLQLLHVDNTSLQNFEGLLALTNLASLGDSYRRRILSEKGFPDIEHYLFEEHEELRRAACECVCNLVSYEPAAKLFSEGEHDRVKVLVLYCAEGQEENDLPLVRAASGALAVLSQYEEVCVKITKTKNWFEILQLLVAHEDPQIQHRGAFILRGMMRASRDLCQHLVGTNMLEVLMALTRMDDTKRVPAKVCAEEALQFAKDFGFIKEAK